MRDRSAPLSASPARSISSGPAARERSDDRPPHGRGDLPHSFGIVQGRNRETGFNQVHAKRVELPGELDLLARAQRKPGRLLAVAQGCVEDGHSVSGHIHGCTALSLNRQIYINEFVIKIVYSNPADGTGGVTSYFSPLPRNAAFPARPRSCTALNPPSARPSGVSKTRSASASSTARPRTGR